MTAIRTTATQSTNTAQNPRPAHSPSDVRSSLCPHFLFIVICCLEHIAIDPACIDHYARTVSEWSNDNTVSFGLRDIIRRFLDCLGR